MGKGGGCVPSKKRLPVAVNDRDSPLSTTNPPLPAETTNIEIPIQQSTAQLVQKLRIYIIFHSMYGHVELLARRMKKGVDSIDGVEAVLYRVPETLPVEILEQMKVPCKENEVPVISVNELVNADGLLFGFPTRFGSMAAQLCFRNNK